MTNAVPRAYAGSFCDATVAEMDEDTRYRTTHAHRCTGEHGSKHGVTIHSCVCKAEFYFIEDMLELVLQKLDAKDS